MNMNYTELKNDLTVLRDADNAMKKSLASKYGLSTRKARDIENAIWNEIKKIRSSKSEFNEDDFHDFVRNVNLGTVKSCEKAFDGESDKFPTFVLMWFGKKLREKNIYKYVDFPASQVKFCTSMGNAYLITEYNSIKKYIDTHSCEYAEKLNRTEEISKMIEVQLSDFKKLFLDKVKENASNYFDNCPNNADKFLKLYKKNQKYAAEHRDVDYDWYNKNVSNVW